MNSASVSISNKKNLFHNYQVNTKTTAGNTFQRPRKNKILISSDRNIEIFSGLDKKRQPFIKSKMVE